MLIQNSIFKPMPKNFSTRVSITDSLELCELAALSLDVYKHPNQVGLPNGWSQFAYREYSKSKTAVALYVKETAQKPIFVTAFRGTVLSFQNLLSNLTVLQGYYPKRMLDSAMDFYWEIIPKLVEKYGSIGSDQMYNTGHSLGAVVADLYGLKSGTFNSITFENPGTKPLLIKLMRDLGIPAEDIVRELSSMHECYAAYLAGVNLINTCNEPTGKTYRLNKLAFNHHAYYRGASLPIPSHPLQNLHYLYYSLDQHKIVNILDYLHAGGMISEINSPIGFAQGYKDYLDLSHEDYWKSYAEMIWEKSINIREDYKNHHEAYLKAFYYKLQQTQCDVLGECTNNNDQSKEPNLHLVLRLKNS